MTVLDYERFADIYALWTSTAASAAANLSFYLEAYRACTGPVVELGVGDGRIAVAAAAAGRHITGVDVSPAMLRLCRERATAAGVLDRLTLIEADFRTFSLHEPAALITLPYHSLGHLQSREAKREAVRHVYTQLQPGGHFLFDDFLMTAEQIAFMRQQQLRAERRTPDGRTVQLWVTSTVDEAEQTIQVVTWEDTLEQDGTRVDRQYRTLSLSWLEPSQARSLLEDTGFTVEACYGTFDRLPFDLATAREQIWVARKDTRA
jgi:SAM-dependent methyltransferase